MNATTDFMLTRDEFELVRDVVYKHCGITLSDEKISLVRARLAKQLRAGSFSSVKAYLSHVLADRKAPAFTDFIDSISTNLTSFFREAQHFDYLKKTFLPTVLARKHAAGDSRLLAWSAACSSGEEPYTLAMVLLDAGRQLPTNGNWDFRVLATDISTAMVSVARTGIYPASRVASVPPDLQSRYFKSPDRSRSMGDREVNDDLRRVVRFRHLNLMDAWPFTGPMDFIFCRNVMIYFDQETQQRLVDRFWKTLAPGGLLFTGHSESLTGITHRFIGRGASIYEKGDR